MFYIVIALALSMLFLVAVGQIALTRTDSEGWSSIDKLIFGYASLIWLISLAVRINVSATVAVRGALCLVAMSLVLQFKTANHERLVWLKSVRQFSPAKWIAGLPAVIGILIPLFPLIRSDSLFIHHFGPDLQGHMLSAASLREGRTYSDFIDVLRATSNLTPWWRLNNQPWTAPDFKWAIEVEFFLRSMRYGHAAIASAIGSMSGLSVAKSFLVAVCIAQILSGLAIYRYFQSYLSSRFLAGVLSAIITCSHSYIIMQREGITAQLFALPLLVFLFATLSKSVVDKLSISEIIRSGIVVAALGVTMTEALQMFATLVLFSLVIVSLRVRQKTWRVAVPNILKVGLVAAVLLNLYLLDFFRVMFLRAQQSFRYSGFGTLGWEPISTLASVPYMKVTGVPGLNISIQARPSVVIALTVLICAAIFIFRRELALPVLSVALSAAITLFAVALTGGGYPLWKTAVMFQPILLLWAVLLLRKFLTQQTVSVLLALYCSVILWSGLKLLGQYEAHSIKLKSDVFTLSVQSGDRKVSQPFVLVTPLTSGLYSYLGSSTSFGYANSGWGPIFRDEQREWRMGFYYSCEIEGAERCKVIERSGLKAKKLYLTDLTVEQLLDNAGRIRGDLLDDLVMQTYGV